MIVSSMFYKYQNQYQMILIELRMCDRMKKTGRCPMNSNKGEILWNEKRKSLWLWRLCWC